MEYGKHYKLHKGDKMNGSSITGNNPIVITSGTLNEIITNDNSKVERFYWLQPDLSSTSSFIISKGDAAGSVQVVMKAETSGQSQVVDLDRQWMDKMFCRCVPSGTLYIYKK